MQILKTIGMALGRGIAQGQALTKLMEEGKFYENAFRFAPISNATLTGDEGRDGRNHCDLHLYTWLSYCA